MYIMNVAQGLALWKHLIDVADGVPADENDDANDSNTCRNLKTLVMRTAEWEDEADDAGLCQRRGDD